MITVAKDGNICTVRLDRADALNAISGAMADELSAVLRELARDQDVWVVILASSGEKAFCVGADLKERADFTLQDFHRNREQIRSLFEALRKLPQPTIASVFGFALGGGFELALSCDLIVASRDAVFGLPEARVGLLAAGGGTQLLTRKVGTSTAKNLIFRGLRIDAEEAHGLGLVVELTDRAGLDAASLEIARDICRSSPVAVRAAKRAIDAGFGHPIDEGMEIENDAWTRVISSDDRAEGIAAFTEKRDPRWTNR